jgi:hypothetical protein
MVGFLVWIRRLQVLLWRRYSLKLQVSAAHVEQSIAVSACQSSLRLSLHTFLYELKR